jgi:hypothetical protein
MGLPRVRPLTCGEVVHRMCPESTRLPVLLTEVLDADLVDYLSSSASWTGISWRRAGGLRLNPH